VYVCGSAVAFLSPLGEYLQTCAKMMIYGYEGEISCVCVGVCVCACTSARQCCCIFVSSTRVPSYIC